MVLKDLYLKVTADASGVKIAMADAGKAVDQFKKQTESLHATGEKLSSLITGGLTAGILALGATITGAIMTTTKFDDIIVRAFQDASDGASIATSAFNEFANAARKMGAASIFGGNQAAQAMKILASQNLSTTDTIKAVAEAELLASSTGIELSSAAQAVGASLRTFGDSGLTAGDAATFLGTAAIKSSLNVEQFSSTLRLVGPLAQTAGWSFKDLVAATATLSDKGIEGMRAMMGMSTTMKELSDPTSSLTKLLGEWGIKVADSKGKLKPLSEVISILSTAVSGNEERFRALTNTAGPAFATLIKGSNDFAKTLTELGKGRETLQKLSKEYSETLPGAFKRFRASGEEALLGLGDSMKEPLITFLNNMSEALLKVASSIDKKAIEDLGRAMVDLVGNLPALINLLSTLANGLTTIVNVINLAVAGVIKLGTYFSSLGKYLSQIDWGSVMTGFATGGAGGAMSALGAQIGSLKGAWEDANAAADKYIAKNMQAAVTSGVSTNLSSTSSGTVGYHAGANAMVTPEGPTKVELYQTRISEILAQYRDQIANSNQVRMAGLINIMEDVFKVNVSSEEQLQSLLRDKLAAYRKRVEVVRSAPTIE